MPFCEQLLLGLGCLPLPPSLPPPQRRRRPFLGYHEWPGRRAERDAKQLRGGLSHILPARTPLDLFFHLEFLHWKATAALPPDDRSHRARPRGRRHVSQGAPPSLAYPQFPFHPRARGQADEPNHRLHPAQGRERPKDDDGGLVKSIAFPQRDSPYC